MNTLRLSRSTAAAIAVMVGTSSAALAADWTFETVNGAPAQGAAFVSFNPDGTFGGSTGCNRFQGAGRVADGMLVVEGPVAMTQMACPGDALTAQDDTIAALFTAPTTIAFDPFNELVILLRDGLSATLSKAGAVHLPEPVPPAPEEPEAAAPAPLTLSDSTYVNVFGISDQLRIHTEPDVSSKVIGRVEAGTLLRNLGCREGGGRDWCNIEYVDASGTQGWAAAEYLEPASASIRAGQGIYDQIGRLGCVDVAGGAAAECEYGVARDRDGTAVVTVFRGDRTQRFFTFLQGEFAFADTSEAGGGFDAVGTRSGEVVSVTVGGERYDVPIDVLSAE